MTEHIKINDVTPRVQYTATSGQTVFTIPFPFFQDGDIVVYEGTSETPISSALYTLAGAGDTAGGALTYLSGKTLGTLVTITRDSSISRTVDFTDGGGFFADNLNDQLDKLTTFIQEVKNLYSRTIRLPVFSTLSSLILPSPSAGRTLMWNSTATGLENGPTASDISDAATIAATAVAAAADAETARDEAETARDEAVAAAASVSLPPLGAANTVLRVNAAGTNAEWEKIVANNVNSGAAAAGQALVADGAGNASWGSSGFTTGDAKLTLKTTADAGWVMMNDGNIGNAASGATTRANADTADLFALLWNNVSNTHAPVSGGRGANAAADFAANKTIGLTKQLGRALSISGAGAGLTSRDLGLAAGTETKTIAEANLPAHTHGAGTLATSSSGAHTHNVTMGADGGAANTFPNHSGDSSSSNIATSSNGAHTHTISGATGSTGSGTALDIMPPSAYWNIMIKL